MTVKEFTEEMNVKIFGEPLSEPVNLGAGLMPENEQGSREDSYMLILGNITKECFFAQCKSFESAGYKKEFNRNRFGFLFTGYSVNGKTVYLSYYPDKKEMRIILDKASCSYGEISYSEKEITDNTILMQFGLYYSHMISGYSCDCGMLYALRLHDNSVIIIDGGELEQATEEACNEIMERLHALTDTEKGECIRISGWFITHNHNDHMDVVSKLIKRNAEELSLERVFLTFLLIRCYPIKITVPPV